MNTKPIKNIRFTVSIQAQYEQGYETEKFVVSDSTHSAQSLDQLSIKLQKSVLNQLTEAKEVIQDKITQIQLESEPAEV